MKYVVIFEYEREEYNGNLFWDSEYAIFQTYEDTVNFMAEWEVNYPLRFAWLHVFEVENDIDHDFMEDVVERAEIKMQEKLQRRQELERELEKNQHIQQEKALLKELLAKYGNPEK